MNVTPDFGSLSADRLRPYLGDWRGSIDWPREIFTDPFARSDATHPQAIRRRIGCPDRGASSGSANRPKLAFLEH